MVEAIKSLSKGAELMIHEGVLMRQRLSELQEANKAATRRKSHKRKQIQKVPLQLRRVSTNDPEGV